MEGKIIVIVGSPRSGKSFLARKLSKHYGVKSFLEGEMADIPERIKEDIAKNIRPLERIIWFRNLFIGQYLKALQLRKQGNTIFMDNFWVGPKVFIDILSKDRFEKDLLHEIFSLDEQIFPMPDLIIHLKASENKIREFLKKGGRDFDQSEEFIKNQVLPVTKMWEDFLNSRSSTKDKILFIDRSAIDFEKDGDFTLLIKKIDSYFPHH